MSLTDGGYTTKMTEWKKKTGFSDVDYIRHLEAALKLACDRIADSAQSFEEAKTNYDWFYYYLYEADHSKVIEN
jgi:hypothetical protein